MAILPAPKGFRVIRGATFDYQFQYLLGDEGSSTPQDLTGYTATWTLHTSPSFTVYTTGASLGQSGVFFGGQSANPMNGIIDLVIVASDTAAISWITVNYTFSLTSPTSVVSEPLAGTMTVVATLP